MEITAICERLRNATYLVNVLLGGKSGPPEPISWGTAVAANSRGDLLTAAHVVTTRLPVRPEDVHDPDSVILAKRSDGTFQRYHPLLCGLTVDLGEFLREPLTVDLAVLRPVVGQDRVPCVPLCTRPPILGEQVLMAGYSDDIELPFSFDQLLAFTNPQVQAQRLNVEIAKRLMMIRSGMIGHVSGVTINEEFSGHVFHIDNVLHSGASGGPVVNRDGELLGILTKRAITRVPYEDTPNLRVPSGAAVAVSPRFLLPKLRELNVVEAIG